MASTVYSITGMASVGDTFYQYQDINILGKGRIMHQKYDKMRTSTFFFLVFVLFYNPHQRGFLLVDFNLYVDNQMYQ